MRATLVLASVALALSIGQLSASAQLVEPNTRSAFRTPLSESQAVKSEAKIGDASNGHLGNRIGLQFQNQTNASRGPTSSPAAASERQIDPKSSVLGALMLCGGGPLPNTLMDTFFELGHAKRGMLVIIPSASSMADRGDFAQTLLQWERFPWASVKILHAQDRLQIENDIDFVKPLQEATAVWISGGDQRRLAERYLGTSVERELKSVVTRGGIIGGTSAGSAIASRIMISGGRQQPVIASGLDLLPGAIIDQHFSQRKRYERLASAVQQHPDRVGIGIDESTGLVVSKKEARVLGTGSVYVYSRTPATTENFEPLRFESGTAFSLPEYTARQE